MIIVIMQRLTYFYGVCLTSEIFLLDTGDGVDLYEILERIPPVKGAKLRRNLCFPGVTEA